MTQIHSDQTISRNTKLTLIVATVLATLFALCIGLLPTKVGATGTPSSTTPCVANPAPTTWKHVVVLMFENHTYNSVIGSTSAPYITNLAKSCGTVTNWRDANANVDGTTNGNYVSKPNYATLTSGVGPNVSGLFTTNHGLLDDSYSTTTSVPSIYSQLKNAGRSVKDYGEFSATTTPCAGSNFGGAYHDAMRYYTPTITSAFCNANDAPISTFMNDVNSGNLPAFSMILPSNSENMHDNTVASGDTWAQNFLNPLLDSAQYKSGDTAVFFLWDEDTPIPNVLLAPSIVAGTQPSVSGATSCSTAPVNTTISHYSATRTWDEMLGLPVLGYACQAPSLLSFYNGGATATPPPVENAPTVSLTAPANGATLTTSPAVLSASATDTDATPVSKVEFYDGTTLVGTDTTSPYSVSWNLSGLSGSHTLKAKAYDTAGLSTTSSSVTVNVSLTPTCSVVPPSTADKATMVVTAPVDSSYHIWSRIMAPDTTNNSYIMQVDSGCPVVVGDSGAMSANVWNWVDYKDGNTSTKTDATLTTGTHTLTMYLREAGVKLDRVILLPGSCIPSGTGDNCTDTTAPTVALTAPTDGATVKGTIAVQATATDNSGGTGVAKVDFYVDGSVTPLATDTAAPYDYSWDTTKVTSSTHTLKAVATDGAGNTGSSSVVSVTVNNTDTTPPSTPTGLATTSVSANEVDLTWVASSDNVAVTGYYLYRDGAPQNTTPLTTTSYKDMSVAANTAYNYSVKATDAAGNLSPVSGILAVTTPPAPDTQAPSAPVLAVPTASATTTSVKVSLSWSASTDNVGVMGYRVLRNGAVISTTSPSTTTYADTTAQPSMQYAYTVVAYDAAGNSATSNNQAIVTPALIVVDTTAPTVATNLSSSVSGTQVNLLWTASTDNVGVVGYNILRGGTKIGTSTTASYGDATVVAGQTYVYSVTAYDAAGNTSGESNQVTVSVPANTITTYTITPSDDADTFSSKPDTNYGSATTMGVDESPHERMLLKFNISQVKGRIVTSAKLRLYNTNPSGLGGSFHGMSDNSWSESTVTWNKTPLINSATLAALARVSRNSYYTVDLSNYITADGIYSVAADSSATDGAYYATKEAKTSQRPTLTLTVQ